MRIRIEDVDELVAAGRELRERGSVACGACHEAVPASSAPRRCASCGVWNVVFGSEREARRAADVIRSLGRLHVAAPTHVPTIGWRVVFVRKGRVRAA